MTLLASSASLPSLPPLRQLIDSGGVGAEKPLKDEEEQAAEPTHYPFASPDFESLPESRRSLPPCTILVRSDRGPWMEGRDIERTPFLTSFREVLLH